MNTKSILAFAAIAAAFAMIASPLLAAVSANAFSLSQFIGQFQGSSQSSQCVSGLTATDSCNNTSTQVNVNEGNQAGGISSSR